MRGEIDVETLLKVLLVLAVVWLGLEILGAFLQTLRFLLEALPKLIGLVLIALIVLYLLDRI